MKLPPFRMHRPTSVEEAVALRDELGDSAAFYCGGTELLLVMKAGMTDLSDLIDVKGIDALRSITFVDGVLRIGAATTHREIERHPLVREHAPALASVAKRIANVRVRSIGTIGGNLAFADPASDLATLLRALGAVVQIRGARQVRREIRIAELCVGAYRTALGEDELIEAVLVAPAVAGTATVHQRIKFKERPAIIATVSLRAKGGAIVDARVVVGAVSAIPAEIVAAEQLLEGASPATLVDAAESAGDAAANNVPLLDEAEEDQVYKRQLIRVLVARCATEAMNLAFAEAGFGAGDEVSDSSSFPPGRTANKGVHE